MRKRRADNTCCCLLVVNNILFKFNFIKVNGKKSGKGEKALTWTQTLVNKVLDLKVVRFINHKWSTNHTTNYGQACFVLAIKKEVGQFYLERDF